MDKKNNIKQKKVVETLKKVVQNKPLTKKDVDILTEINYLRTSNKLKPLLANKSLEAVATQRAKYIYESKEWTHTPQGGKYFRDLIGNKDYSYVGENLARKFKKNDEMVKAWYKSPTHQKNILEDYDETGIGTFGDVTVQIFGRKHKKNGNLK